MQIGHFTLAEDGDNAPAFRAPIWADRWMKAFWCALGAASISSVWMSPSKR